VLADDITNIAARERGDRAGRRRQLGGPRRRLPAQLRKKIWMLVRGLADSMSQYPIDSIRVSDNIEVLTHTEIVALYGSHEKQLERVRWRNNVTGEETEKPIRHVFLFIGADPATSWLRGSGVAWDPKNFVLTRSDVPSDAPRSNSGSGRPLSLETSIPGVFAAGDVRSGSVKQVGAAIGEGAVVGAELHTVLANGAAASARVGDEAKPREARNEQFSRPKG
jgi:thioredoxin reductase (NADPH)